MINKNFLITGGAGFIGSHLVDLLLSRGCSVTVVDDLSTGKLENLNLNNPKLFFVNKSVQQYCEEINLKFDGIFHLAAQASVPLSISNFSFSSINNLESTIKLFEYSSLHDIPIVYASSSAIYGNLDYSVEDGSIDLLSPYAVDKYVMELYCEVLHKIHKSPFFGFRFFNVYGPRQDPSSPYSGVISIFIDRIKNNKDLIINDGTQTRDFVFVKDVVNLLVEAYKILSANSGNYVLNLGTGKSVTINELFSIIKNEMNSNLKPIYRPLPDGDPYVSVCDNFHFESLFNKYHFTTLENGIRQTLESNK